MSTETKEMPEPQAKGGGLSFALCVIMVVGFLAGFAWTLGDHVAYMIIDAADPPPNYSLICEHFKSK